MKEFHEDFDDESRMNWDDEVRTGSLGDGATDTQQQAAPTTEGDNTLRHASPDTRNTREMPEETIPDEPFDIEWDDELDFDWEDG